MSDDEAHPISWMALPERHPVLDRNGEPAGYGAKALGDLRNGRFDGIVVGIDIPRAADPRLMLEVEFITELMSDGIHTNLSAEEITALPDYSADKVWGRSRKKGIGRLLDKLGGDGSTMWDKKK